MPISSSVAERLVVPDTLRDMSNAVAANIDPTNPLTWTRTPHGKSICPTCAARGMRHIPGWVARHIGTGTCK